MARRTRDSGPRWPSWRYGPNGEGAIFQSEAEVPLGWTRKPGDVYVPKPQAEVLDRNTLVELLAAKGVTAAGNWSAAYMKELLTQ